MRPPQPGCGTDSPSHLYRIGGLHGHLSPAPIFATSEKELLSLTGLDQEGKKRPGISAGRSRNASRPDRWDGPKRNREAKTEKGVDCVEEDSGRPVRAGQPVGVCFGGSRRGSDCRTRAAVLGSTPPSGRRPSGGSCRPVRPERRSFRWPGRSPPCTGSPERGRPCPCRRELQADRWQRNAWECR